MRLFAALLACASLFLSPGALAQQMAPDALVKSVTDEVLDIIRKDKDIKAGSTKRAIELVEQKVLPHFNFTRMTALAVVNAVVPLLATPRALPKMDLSEGIPGPSRTLVVVPVAMSHVVIRSCCEQAITSRPLAT